ncbi:STAS domain-containing protein [Marinospirillum sp.]|uniref:STAS domain-containing protein n=1 Tax=Marinospirillum sp. TaxID=2183934 RepID=UPI002870811B|nr:STAS domain-containing protein [Marinospirillum sp.]MDR9467354.1 STAS domain-containing protein [Marinospirillum sp.]
MKKPELIVQSATAWELHGRVDFADAPELAAAFEPQAEQSYILDLKAATGGAPLLLVLLAWCRQARAVGADLQLTRASRGLQRLLALSDLERLLPLDQG